MRYCIFGGNGFVGRYLVEALHTRGEAVHVFDIANALDPGLAGKCAYTQVDIRDAAALHACAFSADDILVNLAANQYHQRVPADAERYFFATNADGMTNILEAGFQQGCRKCLAFTTDMTYGKPLYLPVDTKHPQNPFGWYGKSKKKGEDICRAWRDKGMDITIMRPRMIVGPGRLGILSKLFRLIDLNLPVPTIGSGKNHYQMISVHDCVTAILCAVAHGLPNKEYNLGSKNSPDIRTLLQSLIRMAGSHSIVLPTPGRLVKTVLAIFEAAHLPIMYREQYMIADEEYILDISETEKDLGWSPQYNDADMLQAAYAQYKNMR